MLINSGVAVGDLALEEGNTAEKMTALIAVPNDDGGFTGLNILDVKPGTTLLGNGTDVSGIFAAGAGDGVGLLGQGAKGVWGRHIIPPLVASVKRSGQMPPAWASLARVIPA